MRRFAKAALFAAAAIFFSFINVSAQAGDYYDGGYRSYYDGGYRNYSRNVWYSSNCCYKKIVRHSRSVRYVPTDDGYYDRSYRRSYYGDGYVSRRYVNNGYYDNGYSNGYYNNSYYNNGYGSYAQNCRRERIYDGRGGWVWGDRRCY